MINGFMVSIIVVTDICIKWYQKCKKRKSLKKQESSNKTEDELKERESAGNAEYNAKTARKSKLDSVSEEEKSSPDNEDSISLPNEKI